MNKVLLTGRLTKDVELRSTPNGKEVSSFSVAINNQGDKETTSFINCVAWETSAKFLNQYCKKGNLILIEGHLQTRSYDRKDGSKVTLTEVQVERVENLTPRKDDETKQEPEVKENKDIKTFDDIMDDDLNDLPF